jgi:hypothetical protein
MSRLIVAFSGQGILSSSRLLHLSVKLLDQALLLRIFHYVEILTQIMHMFSQSCG